MSQTGPASERRGFLQRFLIAVAGLSTLSRKSAAEPVATPGNGIQASGVPLLTHMRMGNAPSQPLDTMVLFERGDDNNGRAMTHEVLSLIHQEKGKNSYPWTLYTSLESHHEKGDACVICSRLHKHGPGWSSGVHSEVFNHSNGVALGMNIEMNTDYAGPEATEIIGLNIQAVSGVRPMQSGIQVHNNVESGSPTFETAIKLKGGGKTGIDMQGKYDTGLNMHQNTIRLAEGACIELEDTGRIRVRYKSGRIEFLNGDKCFGHLDVSGDDHAL